MNAIPLLKEPFVIRNQRTIRRDVDFDISKDGLQQFHVFVNTLDIQKRFTAMKGYGGEFFSVFYSGLNKFYDLIHITFAKVLRTYLIAYVGAVAVDAIKVAEVTKVNGDCFYASKVESFTSLCRFLSKMIVDMHWI